MAANFTGRQGLVQLWRGSTSGGIIDWGMSMFKIEMKGLDKVQKHLDNMAKRAAELDGKQQSVSLGELLNDGFIAEHSSFASFDELLAASPFKVKTKEDFEAIPDTEWDIYIAANTSFESWEEMQHRAAAEFMAKQIGL